MADELAAGGGGGDGPGSQGSRSNRGRGRGSGSRGRGRRGHGGRGGASGASGGQANAAAPAAPIVGNSQLSPNRSALAVPQPVDDAGAGAGAGAAAEEEGEPCHICANPISHYSLAPCGHSTCHICALRMRALYKNKDCSDCRTPAPFVIFTDDTTRRYDEYTGRDITSTDDNIGIRYTSEDIVGDTILLLQYNCPEPSCDYAAMGWPALHRHVRTVHNRKMCDLCTRNKKVFTHEHEVFDEKSLQHHMRHGNDQPGADDQTGFKGHPLCRFCGERFYDDDRLYEHCRDRHERCFLCDRRDSRQPHYYRDYPALEKHFREDHFLCSNRECMEKKFVVFEAEMDLKAHQLTEHGNSLSKDVRRDAQVVSMSGFDIRPSYQQERRAGGALGGGAGVGDASGRGRNPNSEPLPVSSAQPLRRDELAFQRQMAIHSAAQSVSSRTFGGQLSSGGPQPSQQQISAAAAAANNAAAGARPSNRSQQQQQQQQQQSPTLPFDAMEAMTPQDKANLTLQDHARLVRHGAVIERASRLLGNDQTKLSTFRSHISSYRKGALTAPQLVDSFFALFADDGDSSNNNSSSSNSLATLVREVADLFDDRSKGEALRKAWQDWRAINEDYPSLPGLGGMHGATTSSSGWANAVLANPSNLGIQGGGLGQGLSQKHTTRVLRLKNSTTRRGSASSSGSAATPGTSSSGGSNAASVPGAIWASAGPSPTAGGTGQRITPKTTPVPSTTSSAAFPALPSAAGRGSANAAPARPSWIGVPSLSASSNNNNNNNNNNAASRPRMTTASAISGGGPTVPRTSGGSGRGSAANEEAFPALPAAAKPGMSAWGYGTGMARRDFGVVRDTGFSWGGGGGGSSSGGGAADGGQAREDGEGDGAAGSGTGGKKKKQGKKQVLVQWG